MASLYQRFTGKINTNNSFPNPPEASHLLGQGAEGERPAESQQRPRLQHQYSRHSEDEDVRINLSVFLFSFWPFLRTRCALWRSDRLQTYRSSKPIREAIYLMPFKSLLITTRTFQRRTCQTSASSPQLAGSSVNTWRAGDVSWRRGVSSAALCCCRRLINPSRRCWNTTSCCWRMILPRSALISTSFGFDSLSVCAHCPKIPKCSRLNEVFSCFNPPSHDLYVGEDVWWISSGSPWRCYNPCVTAGDGAGPAAGWRCCPRCWNTGWLPGSTRCGRSPWCSHMNPAWQL